MAKASSDENEYLPAVQDEDFGLSDIKQPDIVDYPANVAHTTIRASNLEIATMNLKVVREMWGSATSFGRVMRLLKESREAVKFRNDVLGIPNGATGTGSTKNVFEPLD